MKFLKIFFYVMSGVAFIVFSLEKAVIFNTAAFMLLIFLDIMKRRISIFHLTLGIVFIFLLIMMKTSQWEAINPYTGIIIYSGLAIMGLISLVVRRPFTLEDTNGSFDQRYRNHVVRTSIWTVAFAIAALSGYFLMPSLAYFFTPFIVIGIAIILNVYLNIMYFKD